MPVVLATPLQAPQIVPRGPQRHPNSCLEALRSRAGPPDTSRHPKSCLEALRSRAGPPEPPPPRCFRSSSKTARSCCLPVVDPRTVSPVSMPAVSPWAPRPSSKTQARVKACVGQLHVSTWSVEEVERAPTRISRVRRTRRPRWNRRTWISLRCQKAQHRGRATQSALRVDRALEDEVMLATGALRGAGRNSISGSRARSSIGEAAAHRP